ncbi:unnamed protein product [Adineta steineri]|uniref:Apple domain-containing protein n=1 Tax=Adineta steineri TaxID=433720 RepID=A0A814L128_9BILA|nr:unnamed protein product [Adineta steineri]
MIITQIIGEDTGSMILSLVPDSKFQCANTTCLPFINVIKSNIRNCQVACLTQSQCRAATFHRSTSNCELFGDMLNQNGNMLADVDATSMNVVSGTRFPPEPTTTSTSTTSSSTSSSIIDNNGTSLLHICALRGYDKLLSYILNEFDNSFNINVNIIDKYGHTPAHWACLENNIECLIHYL